MENTLATGMIETGHNSDVTDYDIKNNDNCLPPDSDAQKDNDVKLERLLLKDPKPFYMSSEEDAQYAPNKVAGDIPTTIMKRNLLTDKCDEKTIAFDNNNPELTPDSKTAILNRFYENENWNWKRDLLTPEDNQRRFPWKRIAYVVVLLVLGITCAILVLMKLFGGADWMNTATFSVIIMGAVMLLPPGLYYGRILLCICCRFKGYTIWDVPSGPFG